MRYEFWLNETVDQAREYFNFDGYRPGAHMKLGYSALFADFCHNRNHPYVLESLFETFNINHPGDYRDRSLSVGDVVVLIEDGKRTAYACEPAGWTRLLVFDPTTKNPSWSSR